MTAPALDQPAALDTIRRFDGYDVANLRALEFPIAVKTAYLNHAGISPLPRRTHDAMQDANERLTLGPDFMWFFAKEQKLYEGLAAIIHAQHLEELMHIQSTSLGMNMVAQALPWGRGQNVVLCDVEFPSNAYPWMALERYGVETRLVPAVDGGITVEALRPYVDANTRLIAASTVQFFSGHRTDIQAIGEFCHERGIWFAVDCIQSVGHIPLDVQAMHIDILCAGGQKSLLGPTGMGFLYTRMGLAEQMHPAVIGGNATVDYAHWLHYDLTPLPGARRFGMGTFSLANLSGLAESVGLLRELGVPNIERYTTALAGYMAQRLREAGYSVVTPSAPGTYGPIVTFYAAEPDQSGSNEAATMKIVEYLAARGVVVTRHWDGALPKRAYIRASVHAYNTPDDIDRLMTGLSEAQGLTQTQGFTEGH